MKTILIVSILFISISLCAQSDKEAQKDIKAGNEAYTQKQYDQAAASYSKALETDPMNATARFNMANTLYKQDKKDEAAKKLTALAADTKEPELKSKTYYNNGVILSQQKKLEESIEAYKNSLRQNPDDKEARENLQKALLELKKKTPPPPKEKDQKKKQDPKPQQQKQQPKMNQKEAEQKMKLLEQKEKEVQERLQKQKSKTGGGQEKDW